MHVMDSHRSLRRKARADGFTLIEVVVALAISVLLFSGIIIAYTQTTRRAEWSGYSLAAQALAIQQLEQAKSARWELGGASGAVINELALFTNLTAWTTNSSSNYTGYAVNALDLPLSGTNNVVWATNFVTVQMIAVNGLAVPPVKVQMVRVDTVWQFRSDKVPKLFTNTVATYMAPDNN